MNEQQQEILMHKLNKFFETMERIADALEKIADKKAEKAETALVDYISDKHVLKLLYAHGILTMEALKQAKKMMFQHMPGLDGLTKSKINYALEKWEEKNA